MRLNWSTPARRDILRITAYYRAIDPRLSIRMRTRIETAPERLLDRSSSFSLMNDGKTRKARIKGTPLLLFFVTDRDRLDVKRVRHDREDWASDF